MERMEGYRINGYNIKYKKSNRNTKYYIFSYNLSSNIYVILIYTKKRRLPREFDGSQGDLGKDLQPYVL